MNLLRSLRKRLPGPRWGVISVPYVWLLLFFAIPFLIVLKISFAKLAIAMPPYTPILEYIDEALTLTVIDYSRPSTEPRLWVFDLRTRALLYRELVAHGQGSGDNMATRFSNEPDTHRSSLGLFVTGDTYVGENGYSLRLTGLDEGWNDRARERAIVMHGAPYVSADFVRAHGRIGRSWGCPALREGIAREVIDRVKGGGLLFAYYPDQDWLDSSKYLRCERSLLR